MALIFDARVIIKKLKKKLRNRANRSSILFRKGVDLHGAGCSKNNEETREIKNEADRIIEKAKTELDYANELGKRIKEMAGGKTTDLTLEKNGFRLSC